MKHGVGALALILVGVAGDAGAQVCEDNDLASELQYLRRLSLDLRGKLPTMEEYQGVVESGSIPSDFVDGAVESPDFHHAYGRFLRDLLQINLDYGVVHNVGMILTKAAGTDNVWYSNLKSTLYRGGTTSVPCLDKEVAYEDDGVTIKPECNGTVCQEGWVMVTPFWDPTTQVKVCAYDAQDAAFGHGGKPCDEAPYDSGCGCGPNLDWCYRLDLVPGTFSKKPGYFYHKTEDHYVAAINEQVTRIGTRILQDGRPYTDLLTSTRMEVNGRLVHFLQNKGKIPYVEYDLSHYFAALPNLTYLDDQTWLDVDVTAPGAAGVLTSVFYLVRYASNRSRANRFYQAFLCKDFVGPPEGLPPPADPLNQTPNLMVREGCDYCHKELEPAAAHWGRWNPIGAQHYATTDWPDTNIGCLSNPGDPACALYLTEAKHEDEVPYLGYFRPLLFSKDGEGHGSDAIAAAVAGGPRELAQQAIDDGSFAACTTKQVWRWLMGRDAADIDAAEMELLTQRFLDTDYDFKDLVRTLVTSEAYREHEYVLPEGS